MQLNLQLPNPVPIVFSQTLSNIFTSRLHYIARRSQHYKTITGEELNELLVFKELESVHEPGSSSQTSQRFYAKPKSTRTEQTEVNKIINFYEIKLIDIC